MAKKKLSFNFSRGIISKDDDGKFVFTEITKDDETTYNLQSVLESLIDVENVSISLGTEDSIPMVTADE